MSLTPEQETSILRFGRYPPKARRFALSDTERKVSERVFGNVILEVIVGIRREIIDELLPPLVKRISDLEERLAALEARPASGGVEYKGVWESNRKYLEGSLCTHAGGLWLAKVDSYSRPGGGNDDWVLCVKSGRAEDKRR